MKTISLLMAFIAITITISAQNVGVGTSTPHASAQLDVSSNSKGLLLPRNTTAGIVLIVNPAKGLLILDTIKNQLMVNMGTPDLPNWQTIVFESGWSLTGNTGTNPANNFIGTIDKRPLQFKINNLYAGSLDTLNNVLIGINTTPVNKSFSSVAIGPGAFQTGNGGEIVAIGINSLSGSVSGIWNTAVGSYSLAAHKTGSLNTAIGYAALDNDTSGTSNTAVGAFSLSGNKSGFNNNAFGSNVLRNNDSGSYNTAAGSGALFSNIGGHQNSSFGRRALYNNISGSSNTAVGNWALHENTVRSNLVAIGDSALFNNGSGAVNSFDASYNTAVGSKALFANTTGYSNTAVGYYALDSNTAGVQNTAIGTGALQYNKTGANNTAIGPYALYKNVNGNNNTAIGEQSLSSATSASNNTAEGFFALGLNTTGNDNIALGIHALHSNTTRGFLVAIGDSALYNNGIGATVATEAVGNTAIGSKAMYFNNKGYYNTALGFHALYNNTTGYNNLAIGSNADLGSGVLFNATAIGANAIVNASNTIQLGNGSVTTVSTAGNITVQNGKGIIRSNDGIQQKKLTVAVTVSGTIGAGGTVSFPFIFPEVFGALPDVYVGHVTAGGGFAEKVMTVANITVTGGSLFVYNPKQVADVPNYTVKIIAIGSQ